MLQKVIDKSKCKDWNFWVANKRPTYNEDIQVCSELVTVTTYEGSHNRLVWKRPKCFIYFFFPLLDKNVILASALRYCLTSFFGNALNGVHVVALFYLNTFLFFAVLLSTFSVILSMWFLIPSFSVFSKNAIKSKMCVWNLGQQIYKHLFLFFKKVYRFCELLSARSTFFYKVLKWTVYCLFIEL